SGAKKKFKVSATGKLLRRAANQSHNLEHKPAKQKRAFSKDKPVATGNLKAEETVGEVGDAARQASSPRAEEAPQGARGSEGLLGSQEHELPLREGAGRPLARLRVPRPQEQEACVPAPLDHPDQRRRTRARALVQPVHLGLEGRERRARPQGARRPRRVGSRCIRQARRAGEVRTGLSSARQEEVFLRQAAFCETRSPLYARLCRRFAHDPAVAAIAPDLNWDFPLRLLGGLHYLVLGGEASWDDVDAMLEEHAPFLARFAAEQPVQTNEV